MNCKMPKYKTVFSLRIKQELKKMGFDPILETDNINKPGFKCWIYELSPSFMETFLKIAEGGKSNGGYF